MVRNLSYEINSRKGFKKIFNKLHHILIFQEDKPLIRNF